MTVETIFIPALLCDGGLYADLIDHLGDAVSAQILMSPKPTLEESAADILARAPEKFVLVGTSYGGNLALEIALAAPERIAALWLMGCDPSPAPEGRPELANALSVTPDAVIDALAASVAHPDHTAAAAAFKSMAMAVGSEAGVLQAGALGVRRDAVPRLGTLTMPTLILWGADDALVPVAIGQSLADALPHAHFHVLPQCGHLPTLERPAEAADLFRNFLSEELT